MTDTRLSHLADLMCTHLIFRRDKKALLIAQYLRKVSGMRLVPNLNVSSGHRVTS